MGVVYRGLWHPSKLLAAEKVVEPWEGREEEMRRRMGREVKRK